MMDSQRLYIYNGPVMLFDTFIGNWYGETFAVTSKKAKANLKYQYKMHSNLSASSRIDLPAELIEA